MEQEIRSSSLPSQLQLFCLQAYTKLHYVPGLHTPFLSRFLRIPQFGCSLKSLRLFSLRPQSCLLCHPNFLSSSSVSPLKLFILIPPYVVILILALLYGVSFATSCLARLLRHSGFGSIPVFGITPKMC